MFVLLSVYLLSLVAAVNGCTSCPAFLPLPAADCPSGSICDGTLITRDRQGNCNRVTCSSGQMLVKSANDMLIETTKVVCNSLRNWTDEKAGVVKNSGTCVLTEEDRKCSYPALPNPIPEGYKVNGQALYNKTTRTLKCSVPTASLITMSRIGLGTKPDGCLHVESAMCADVFKCERHFTEPSTWVAVPTNLAYSSPPTINMQTFTATCPMEKTLAYVSGGAVLSTVMDMSCSPDGKWLAGVAEVQNAQAACFTHGCPEIEKSNTCGDKKTCGPAMINAGEYTCPKGYDLVFVHNGKTKVGAGLVCDNAAGKWKSEGVVVEECSAVRCEMDRCPALETIALLGATNAAPTAMVRQSDEKYVCPPPTPLELTLNSDKYTVPADYTYDVYVDSKSTISKKGKSLSCAPDNEGTWGWKTDNGDTVLPEDTVGCSLKKCELCVPEQVHVLCAGAGFTKPKFNTTTKSDSCKQTTQWCPAGQILRVKASVPATSAPTFKAVTPAFTCNNNGVYTGSPPTPIESACCAPLATACLITISCDGAGFVCAAPAIVDGTKFTCPSGHTLSALSGTTETPYTQASATCSAADAEWYPDGATAKINKVAKLRCRKN